MKITVYGPGCEKCHKLQANVEEAVRQAGVEAEVEKVEKAADIARAGVLFTPGLAIDGKVVVSGKVPDVAKIVALLEGAR